MDGKTAGEYAGRALPEAEMGEAGIYHGNVVQCPCPCTYLMPCAGRKYVLTERLCLVAEQIKRRIRIVGYPEKSRSQDPRVDDSAAYGSTSFP